MTTECFYGLVGLIPVKYECFNGVHAAEPVC